MIVLDTDVMIDLLREYPPAVTWLESIGEEEVVLPGFVVMELIQGCRNKGEQERVKRELSSYCVEWPSSDMCDEALSVFVRYYLSHGIGILDTIIGQMAVALTLPLYTFNKKHYEVIPGLKIVQPYDRSTQ